MRVSQGNVAQGNEATCLRCGEIFNHQLIANLLLSEGETKWKSVNIWRSFRQE